MASSPSAPVKRKAERALNYQKRFKRLLQSVILEQKKDPCSKVHNYIIKQPIAPRFAVDMYIATQTHLQQTELQLKEKWHTLQPADRALYETLASQDARRYYHEIQARNKQEAVQEVQHRLLETRMVKERHDFSLSLQMRVIDECFVQYCEWVKKPRTKTSNHESLNHVWWNFYRKFSEVPIGCFEEMELAHFVGNIFCAAFNTTGLDGHEDRRSHLNCFLKKCLSYSCYEYVWILSEWAEFCLYFEHYDNFLKIVRTRDVLFVKKSPESENAWVLKHSGKNKEYADSIAKRYQTMSRNFLYIFAMRKKVPLDVICLVFYDFAGWRRKEDF